MRTTWRLRSRTRTMPLSFPNQSRWYDDEELIACAPARGSSFRGGVCAFLQGTGGATGSQILGLAHYISDHGCLICGSVPFTYPSGNDVSHGELTYIVGPQKCSSQEKYGLCGPNSGAVRNTKMRTWITMWLFYLIDDISAQPYYLSRST